MLATSGVGEQLGAFRCGANKNSADEEEKTNKIKNLQKSRTRRKRKDGPRLVWPLAQKPFFIRRAGKKREELKVKKEGRLLFGS